MRGSDHRSPSEIKAARAREWDQVAAALPSLQDDAIFAVTAQAAAAVLDAVHAGPGMRLLDVACGPGQWVPVARARGVHIVGIDFSPGMIAEALRRNPDLDARVGDAEALAFPDRSFDALVCNLAIKGFPQPDLFLTEGYRVLRPGGRLAFTTWYEHQTNQLFRVMEAAVTRVSAAARPLVEDAHAPSWAPPDCEALLRKAGFADVAAPVLVLSAVLEQPDLVLDHVYTIGKLRRFLMAQSEDVRRRMEGEIIAEAMGAAQDGVLTLHIPVVLAYGMRPAAP